jgi:hypothetical protein
LPEKPPKIPFFIVPIFLKFDRVNTNFTWTWYGVGIALTLSDCKSTKALSTLWNIGDLCVPLLSVAVSAYKTGKKRQTKTTIFFPRKEKKEKEERAKGRKKRYAGHTAMQRRLSRFFGKILFLF